MYNVIFLRGAYYDSRHDSEGLLRIFTCETNEEVRDIIRKECLEQLSKEHQGASSNTCPEKYGEYGFIVMHNGRVIQSPGYIANIDIYVYGTPEDAIAPDVSDDYTSIIKQSEKHHDLMLGFIRSLQGVEDIAKKALHEKMLADQAIEKEKQTLRALLEKYPEMAGK